MWMIISLVVIAFVIFINAPKRLENSKINIEKNEPIIEETLSKLKILEQYSHLPFIGEECGLVTVVPVNSNGSLTNPKADRLKLSLLLYINDTKLISSYEPRTNISSSFHLQEENNVMLYISITSELFYGDYTWFMPYLYAAIRDLFPKIDFEFNGTSITTRHL